MKTFRNPVPALALLTLCLDCNSRFSIGFAQGMAFTYQGCLNDKGVPVTGSYDVQFALYATNVMGNPVAGPATNIATMVSNGLFTVAVDFGPGIFAGETY